MAVVTGTNLLQEFLDAQGVELSSLMKDVLSARLQQMLDAGTDSNFQIAAVLASNPVIRASVPEGEVPLTFIADVVGDAKTTIIDEPVEPIETTYTITSDVDSVDEGGTVTFTVTADEAVVEDTEVAYTLSGVDAADVDGELTGTVTILAGETAATFAVTLLEDVTTEGAETLTATLEDGAAADVAVADTSMAPAQVLSIEPASTTIVEGNELVFTVTMDRAVDEDTVIRYQVQGVATDIAAAATPVDDLGVINGEVLIAADGDNPMIGTFSITPSSDGVTEGFEAFKVVLLNDDNTAGLSTANIVITDPANAGQSFTLTTGVDDFTGGAGDDTFTASDTTLTALDALDGGAGADVLIMNDTSGNTVIPGGVTIAGIETINWRSADDVGVTAAVLDTSSVTGLQTLNVTLGKDVFAKAAASTDVNVSGVTGGDGADIDDASAPGLIQVDGGNNIEVTDAAYVNDIKIGATTAAAGTITVTDSNVGAAAIQVDGGTDITINASETDGSSIKVGTVGTTPTGVVTITSDTDADATDTLSAIEVKGGTTVTVNQEVTTTDDLTAAAITVTQGAVKVTGTDDTTSVTVNQTAAATGVQAVEAVAGVNETEVVTFVALAAGETVTVDGLTFTASKALTAEQVATAFSNLSANDTQDDLGPVANGFYSGVTSANFTSGAASGATVTFTEVTANLGNNVAVADTAAAGNVTRAQGVTGSAATTAVTGVLGVVGGAVTVIDQDGANATIETITLDAYGAGSDIQGADALTTLSLSNSAQNLTVDAAVEALTLNLNKVTGNAVLDLDDSAGANNDSITTLTINSTGSASTVNLEADAVTDVTVDAAVGLDISGTPLAAVETVTVSGAGAVNLGDISATAKSITATDNTGGVTATIDGTLAAFTGGAGADAVTVDVVNPTKAINLGAGDDTLTLTNGTSTSTEVLEGGEGTDTLVLTAADAETNSGATTFEAKINSFEHLTIGNAAGQEVVNLANLDDISYVTLGAATGTAQVNTVTVTAAVDDAADAGDVFTVTINGTTFSHTATAGQTEDNISQALVALINADTSLAVTAADAAGNFTLTADAAGVPFAVTVANPTDVGGADADIAVAATTPNAYGITLNNLANNGTVVLTAASTASVTVTDAATNATDILNVITTNNAIASALTADDVETINIATSDATTAGVDTQTLSLSADAAETVVVSGAGNLVLATVASELTLVDGSASLTGALTYTAGADNLVVKGGSGADNLTAAADDVELHGGAGNDTLTVNSGLRVDLFGGDGADTFIFSAGASATLDAYTVINGVDTGDVIQMTGASAFSSTEIALSVGADETLLNYANQAVKTLDQGEMGWFQRGGNTYIVQDQSDTDAFVAGTDMVIMILGEVDLSTASYNSTSNILEMA